MLSFKLFSHYQELLYGLSEIADGAMNAGGGETKEYARAQANRHQHFANLGFTPSAVVSAVLSHGTQIHEGKPADGGIYLQDADGIVTSARDLLLTVTTADCFPVYLYDPGKQAVGLLHAGWRGTASGIIHNALQAMQDKFGSTPSDILVAIGPGIQACHYEVHDDVLGRFAKYPAACIVRDGKTYLDLPRVLAAHAQSSGIRPKNIEVSFLCTYEERTRYFSARRNPDAPLETMVAYVAVKKRENS